jgi:uncharacterized protein (DUF983 family)
MEQEAIVTPKGEVKVVFDIIATEVKIRCPYCGEIIDGWYADPRGLEDTCEECGGTYKTHLDADIDFY